VQTKETTSASTWSARLPVLDGLRGLVIPFLLLHHFGSLDNPQPGAWVHHVYHFIAEAGLGLIGLDVFFVLSGFLITGILLDTKQSPTYFRAFYARRCLRIFPLYYGFLFVYFVVLPALTAWSELDLSAVQHVAYWGYLTNVVQALKDWWDPALKDWWPLVGRTGHLWSLAVEEQFYLVWPAIVFLTSRATFKRICLACLAAAPLTRLVLVLWLGSASEAAYLLTPARMDGLALGSLIAICAREPEGLRVFVRWARPVAVVCAIVVTAIFVHDGHYTSDGALEQVFGIWASVYISGAYLIMTLATTKQEPWGRLIGSWPLRQLGQYSYAIYVLHYPLSYALARAGWLDRPDFIAWGLTPLQAEFAYTGTMAAIAFAAGALSWHLWEKHFLKLRRLVPYRRPAPTERVALGATATGTP
jgi:peptidoglycan/LPS O-acetylase OafA/YrhL